LQLTDAFVGMQQSVTNDAATDKWARCGLSTPAFGPRGNILIKLSHWDSSIF